LLLRRSKTIDFNDDPDPSEASIEAPMRASLRRNLDALRNASLRMAPPPVREEPEMGEDSPRENPVHQRFDQLRSELEQAPISKGSQESLAALREEFRRKHVSSEDGAPASMPSFSLAGFRYSRILLVAVALAAGGLAAFLAISRQPEPTPEPVAIEAPPPAPTLEVLVAKSSIGPGTRLTPELLEWQKWPEETVRAEYITSVGSPEAMNDFADAVARSEIIAGEPIRAEKLGSAGAGFLSAILAPGKRGVSVAIDARAASGGFIVPNDHVDVVLTRGAGPEQISRTILSNVRVIAINARLGRTDAETNAATPEEGVFSDGALATLELDSAQAELIINATSSGALSLVLRPASDMTTAADASQQAINQSIRLTSPFWQPAPPTGLSTSGGVAPVYTAPLE
jgi:pilus assembly protein CpaB